MGIEFEKIKLRDYQQEAIDNMYELFNEGKRSATVLLPTGGGKTYVALDAMAREMKPSDKEGVISETSIFYFAPNDGIVQQTLERISEYMIGDRPEYKGLSVEAKVKKAFPNLKVKCYQSMKSRENGDKLSKENDEYLEDVDADFCIFDEAHRGAAETFGKKIKSFVRTHSKAKFLNITATPERDADLKNVMQEIARETGYSDQEISSNKYIAKNLNLLEAIEDGLVVKPEILFFPCTLDESDEYKKVEEAYFEAERNERKTHSVQAQTKRNNLETIYRTMNVIIGKAKYIRKAGEILETYEEYSEEEWNKIKKEKIQEIMARNIKLGDKTAVFIPETPQGIETEDFIEEYKKKVRELVKSSVGEENVFVEGYHSKFDNSQNRKTLEEFNKYGREDGKNIYAALVTYKMLDEGVHADGVNSEFMFKQTGSERNNSEKNGPSINLLQKLGRCITSLDPEHPEKTKIPKVYDFGANFVRNYTRFLEMSDGKQTFYELPKEMNEFLNLYQMFEKRNQIAKGGISFNKDETGKTSCMNLLVKYNDGTEKSIDSLQEVKKAKRTITGDKKTSKTYTSNTKNTKGRFERFRDITEVLNKNGIQINTDTVLNKEFFDNISINAEEILKEIYEKTGRHFNFSKEYEIGKELEHFRDVFWKRPKNSSKILKELNEQDFKVLFDLGILDIKVEELPEGVVDKDGFVMANSQYKFPESFIGKNIYTGTEFSKDGKDEYGCYADGYDDNGYDRYGFDRAGLHRTTRETFDQRGFYKDENGEWKNKFTSTDYDKLGYNHDGINRRGFDRSNMWHKKLENGKYSRNVEKRDKDGLDAHLFNAKSRYYSGESIWNFDLFRANGIHQRTGTYRNPQGYDIDGYDENEFNKEGICKATSCKVNRKGRNTKGELVQEFQITNDMFNYVKSGEKNLAKFLDGISKKYGISINEMKDVIDEKMAEAYTLSSIASECEEAKKMKEEVVKLSMTNPDLIQRFVKFSPRLEADLRRESISLNKALVALNKMLDEKLKKAKVDEKEVEEIKKKYSEVDIRKKNIDRIAPPNPKGSLSNTDDER